MQDKRGKFPTDYKDHNTVKQKCVNTIKLKALSEKIVSKDCQTKRIKLQPLILLKLT